MKGLILLSFSVCVCVCVCARVCNLLVLGGEVSGAVGDLCVSVLYDLSANGDVSHSVLSAVGVGRLEERHNTLGWRGDKRHNYELNKVRGRTQNKREIHTFSLEINSKKVFCNAIWF